MDECATIKIFLLSGFFAILAPIIHSQDNIPSEAIVTLSPEDIAKISKLPSGEQPYFVEVFKQKQIYSSKNVFLATEHSKLQTKYYNMQCLLPHIDLRCAMLQMQTMLDEFFESHLKNIVVHKTRPDWVDKHTQDIVNNCDNRPNSIKRRHWRANVGSDCKSKHQWYIYLTSEPLTNNTVHKKIRHSLGEFYNALGNDTKEDRGYTNLDAFKLRFASIMTRCHRFSCHFHHNFDHAIAQEFNKCNEGNLSLSQAIIKVVPTWYFDAEHIEFLNIMQEVSEKPGRFYVVKNITNSLNKPVVIPGLPNCGKEDVNSRFYEKLYSLDPNA